MASTTYNNWCAIKPNSSISNNSVKYKNIFVYKHLNVKMVLFQTIQFSTSTQVQCQKTVPFQIIHKHTAYFYLTHRYDPIKYYHSGPDWISEQWQWIGTPHFPKLQHYWNLAIKSGHLAGGGWSLTPLQRISWCILQSQPTRKII